MDIERIASFLTSGKGYFMAAGLLYLVMEVLKKWPWLTDKLPLKEVWQKRVLAAVLATLPAIALALTTQAPLIDIAQTAIAAFLGATFLNKGLEPNPAGGTVAATLEDTDAPDKPSVH